MKVALIRQRYNAYGGAERFVDQAMAAVAAEGSASITLVTRDWNAALDQRRAIKCDPFYIGRTWRDRGFARATCDATRAGFDLVQSHERIACCDVYRAGDGVHAQWLENRAGAIGPLRGLATRMSPWHRYTLAAEKTLFASPHLRAIICNSKMVAAEIQRHFGVPAEKLRVIYNGVDCARFDPGLKPVWREKIRKQLGIPPAAFMHLFVGSGFERKGVPQLIQAMRDVAGEPHLVIVGADRKTDSYRSQAAACDLGARVHFPGPQANIEAWYAAADCFVLPTLYDPFPNAAMEAMACGLPVITTRQCGAAELVEPAGCGWACDALDVAALTALLGSMNFTVATAMGQHARTLAEQFTLESMASQMAQLYRELLAMPKA